MNRAELEHAIRAACDLAQDAEVYVFGSQAIPGQYPDAPAPLRQSMEADIAPKNRPEMVDPIDAVLGELSQFRQTHGFYVHGVPIEAAVLPTGWDTRAVPVRNASTRGNTGWCLEGHDLAASKLVAYRDKDREFVRVLFGTQDGRAYPAPRADPEPSGRRGTARSDPRLARRYGPPAPHAWRVSAGVGRRRARGGAFCARGGRDRQAKPAGGGRRTPRPCSPGKTRSTGRSPPAPPPLSAFAAAGAVAAASAFASGGSSAVVPPAPERARRQRRENEWIARIPRTAAGTPAPAD